MAGGIGGIVGINYGDIIENSYSKIKVENKSSKGLNFMNIGSICGKVYTGKINKSYGNLDEIIGESSYRGCIIGNINYAVDAEEPEFNDVYYSKGKNNFAVVGGNNHESIFGSKYTSATYYVNIFKLASKEYSSLNEFLNSF